MHKSYKQTRNGKYPTYPYNIPGCECSCLPGWRKPCNWHGDGGGSELDSLILTLKKFCDGYL